MMHRRLVRALLATAVGVVLSCLGGEDWRHPGLPSIQAQPAARFVIFDGTLYKNKPDLSRYGVQPIRIIYSHEFWDGGESRDGLPTKDRVRRVASSIHRRDGPAVVDIEQWPTSPAVHKVTVTTAQESIRKYATVLRWVRESATDLSVGLYGIVPIIDYWRAVEPPSSVSHQTWVADNERAKPLVELVDALFPSLYTFYVDREGWVNYAVAQLTEAKRLAGGRPVYVFLWPQYHDSHALLRGKYLPEDYWKLELDTVRKYADGVVIWGGWGDHDRPADWDEGAPWWIATKEFLNKR